MVRTPSVLVGIALPGLGLGRRLLGRGRDGGPVARPVRAGRRAEPDGERRQDDVAQLGVGPRDHRGGEDGAHPGRRRGGRGDRRGDRGDLPLDLDGDHAGAVGGLVPDEPDVRGLHRDVGGLDGRGQTEDLDLAQGVREHCLSSTPH